MVAGRLMRFALRVLKLLVILTVVGAAASLPLAGRFLVREDPVAHADAIFVLAGGRAERWLEGVQLYKEDCAPIVLLSPGIVDPTEQALRAKGIRLPAEADIARDAMMQLGVPDSAIERIEGSVDNTAQEAARLHAVASRRGWHQVIVVTSKYHSRRTAFAFRRELAGSGTAAIVRTSRYDRSDPAHWWRQRGDMRFVLSEYEKLLAYRLGLGE
jgi:uncharacterized SAM-binding protein YcdF (DUF218 family)